MAVKMNTQEYLETVENLKIEQPDGGYKLVRAEPDGNGGYRLREDDLGVFFLFFTNLQEASTQNACADLGHILFDDQGYWVYEGTGLAIDEQEQLAYQLSHAKSDWKSQGITGFFERHAF